MQDAYDIIKRTRDLLATIPKRELKGATKKDYAAKVRRLGSKLGADQSYAALLVEAMKTSKKSTWQANRAAVIFVFANGLRGWLEQQDKLQRGIKAAIAAGSAPEWTEWQQLVSRIEGLKGGLEIVLAAQLPIEGREDRHTKRQDMRGLPEDWRERIISRMPKYHAQALVAAVTGCRPDELVTGVLLAIDENNRELVAMVRGSKVTEKSGQSWRRLSWQLDNKSELVQQLVDLVRTQPPDEDFMVSLTDAKAFSGAMRAAGKREWPKRQSTVTPYCMRHQAAADMKASGSMSSGEISAALGHVSDVTKSTYGHANMGRKSGGVAPSMVESARPVQTKAPSKAAAKRVAKAAEPSDQSDSPGMSM